MDFPDPRPDGPGAAALRILVADGYADAADSLALLLRLLGHEVRVAHTGPEALRAALEMRPDAVVADLVLPYLDGCGLARGLREGGLSDTLLVALTGLSTERYCRQAREAGFNAHFLKPADPVELERLLAARVRRPQPRRMPGVKRATRRRASQTRPGAAPGGGACRPLPGVACGSFRTFVLAGPLFLEVRATRAAARAMREHARESCQRSRTLLRALCDRPPFPC